jgi:endonuclease/exonuclease/phosphatase family metal-dependent hydrolase
MSFPTKTVVQLAGSALTCALVVTMTSESPSSAVTPTSSAVTDRAAVAPRAAPGVDVHVAGFNVQSVGVDKRDGNRLPWRQRRSTVISQILREHTDVIGAQEVNPSNVFRNRLVDGTNQMFDLRNGLNRRGGHFALNSNAAANCLNPASTYRCKPRNRAASNSERILYNTSTMLLMHRGFVKYTRQSASAKGMGMAWVMLRSRRNGHLFLFTSTHLDPPNRSVRAAQWRQMVSNIKRIRRDMPVVSVGDFNTQKMDPMTRTMLPMMRNAGVGDVLNQQYRVNPSRGVRAESVVNGWINSNNRESRNIPSYSYPNNHSKTGNSIDYIFASNALRVKRFEMVIDYNPRTLQVTGTMPSDHNMLAATIVLP